MQVYDERMHKQTWPGIIEGTSDKDNTQTDEGRGKSMVREQ